MSEFEAVPQVAVIEADPSRPWKAYVSAGLSAVGTFVAFWIADADPFTKKEAAQAVLAAVVASGLTGGTTFWVRNPIRSRTIA